MQENELGQQAFELWCKDQPCHSHILHCIHEANCKKAFCAAIVLSSKNLMFELAKSEIFNEKSLMSVKGYSVN
jgi:hypothetical protein